MDHFLCIWSVALANPVGVIGESGGHGGKLDLCVFSRLTGKNLSLPVPVEKGEDCRAQAITIYSLCARGWPLVDGQFHS